MKSVLEWKAFQSDLKETSVFEKCLSWSIGVSIIYVDFELNITWKKCSLQKVLSVDRYHSTLTWFIHWHDLSDALFSLGYARDKNSTHWILFQMFAILLYLSRALMLLKNFSYWTHCVTKPLKIYSRTSIYDFSYSSQFVSLKRTAFCFINVVHFTPRECFYLEK